MRKPCPVLGVILAGLAALALDISGPLAAQAPFRELAPLQLIQRIPAPACGSPRHCPPVFSTACGVVFHKRNAITMRHDNHLKIPDWHITSRPARPAKPAS